MLRTDTLRATTPHIAAAAEGTAMLNYLNSDPWVATAPTRTTPVRPWSCSREPGNYKKTEVRNGAKALVRWEVSVGDSVPTRARWAPASGPLGSRYRLCRVVRRGRFRSRRTTTRDRAREPIPSA